MSCGPCRPRGGHSRGGHHGKGPGGGHPGSGPGGQTPPPQRPSRLYRNRAKGKISGVCAGIADYFGISTFIVRLIALISLFMFTFPTLVCYFLATLLIDPAPEFTYQSEEEKEFWRQVRVKPSESLSRLRHKFRDQEQRVRAMEAFVTSAEARLHREFRDL
ncbi:envelope stress response membrane protein PspC [Pelagibius sp.]|uniref:envelope stress response membrane protein PspC n=1 Tax=Pelagibius sp. TaxID=1931238 RepID=UPI00262DC848|nr:envelope stress response membrane protein PspC [Pelagibius sp.]